MKGYPRFNCAVTTLSFPAFSFGTQDESLKILHAKNDNQIYSKSDHSGLWVSGMQSEINSSLPHMNDKVALLY